jgi:hypothetical protein
MTDHSADNTGSKDRRGTVEAPGVPRPNPAVLIMLLVIGASSLVRFSQNLFQLSQNVRVVDVVGVSGGGAACGAALFGLVFALMSKRKP